MYFKATVSYMCPQEAMESEDVMTNDNQAYRSSKNSYLVNAESVTHAEAKILKELPNNYQDKTVKGVTPSNVNTIVFSTGDEWFLFGVKYGGEPNKKGKVKYYHEYTMINGDDIDDAIANLREHHKDTVSDYRIVSFTESKIIIERDLLTSDVITRSEPAESE
jgi:hypothetical protein